MRLLRHHRSCLLFPGDSGVHVAAVCHVSRFLRGRPEDWPGQHSQPDLALCINLCPLQAEIRQVYSGERDSEVFLWGTFHLPTWHACFTSGQGWYIGVRGMASCRPSRLVLKGSYIYIVFSMTGRSCSKGKGNSGIKKSLSFCYLWFFNDLYAIEHQQYSRRPVIQTSVTYLDKLIIRTVVQ